MNATCRILACGLTLFISIAFSHAQDWEPEPPTSSEWDWIQLTSHEWLKGEFIAMYDESFEFDSDKLGLLTFDFEDIKQFRSGDIIEVRFLGDRERRGHIIMENDEVIFSNLEETYPVSHVLTMTTGATRELDHWTSKISVGLNLRSGNTEQKDLDISGKFQRRTLSDRISIDYLSNFSETSSVTTAESLRLSLSWDRFLNDRLFWRPAFGEYSSDEFQNIDHRYSIGTGLGYTLIDTAKMDYLIVAGPAYQETRYVTIDDSLNSDIQKAGSFVFETEFAYEITRDIDYYFDYKITLAEEDSGGYSHHLDTGLEIELTSRLDLDLSIIWDRIENPQADEDGVVPEQDDYRMVLGVGWEF